MNKLAIIIFLSLSIKHNGEVKGFSVSHSPFQYDDTTIFLFADVNYRLTLHIYKSIEGVHEDETNATLTLSKKVNGQTRILLHDSLFCSRPEIKLVDFSNDHVKDIMITHAFDVRSNQMNYLYIVDNKLKKIFFVKGFEEIRNPEFDGKNNIITSYAVSGKDYYSFYRISKKNKLIDLNKSFDAQKNENDSINYEKAIRAIRRTHN